MNKIACIQFYNKRINKIEIYNYLNFNAERAIRPSKIDNIQQRIIILDSGRPFNSK